MSYYIRAKTIPEAWEKILRVVWNKGETRTKDEWGSDTREVLNLVVNVSEPTAKTRIPEGYPWNSEKLEEYARTEFLSADNRGFVYTYGQRLHNYDGLNQIEEVISRLKAAPNTRRAVATSWKPSEDSKNEEVPCLVLWDWKIRDGKLHQTTCIRSNDMYGAWPANAFGLTRLLEHVAREVGVEPGSITTHSISAHVYSRDFDMVKKILGVKE
ncbi:MAG: thymidylate synthase [Candidatus Micrarchaeota archaeon]